MKILFFIFSFYTLFLALQPGIRNIIDFGKEQEESCCNESCEPFDEEQGEGESGSDNTDKKVCNPFQSCKCCIVYKTNHAILINIPFAFFDKPGINQSESIPSQITIDFWQPPKILS